MLNKPFFSLSGVSSVHCPAAIPSEKAYYDLHYYENTCPPDGVKFISSAMGIVFKPTPHDSADSIRQHCIDKIDFPKDVELAYKEGARLFLELGPKSSMTRMINAVLGDRPHFARAVMPANQPQTTSLLKFIANCAAEGIRIDLSNLYGREVLQIKSDVKSKLKPVAVYTGHVPTLAGVERKDPLVKGQSSSDTPLVKGGLRGVLDNSQSSSKIPLSSNDDLPLYKRGSKKTPPITPSKTNAVFDSSPHRFFAQSLQYTAVTALALFPCLWIREKLLPGAMTGAPVSFLSIILMALIVTAVYHLIFFLFFGRTEEMHYLTDLLRSRIKGRRER